MVELLYGKDVERIIRTINTIKKTTTRQIELLAHESDYRLEMIHHTHSVHVRGFTGSTREGVADALAGNLPGDLECPLPTLPPPPPPEFLPNPGEPPPIHVHMQDGLFSGRDHPPATGSTGIAPAHETDTHYDHVSDQLTYPVKGRGYLGDEHESHPHMNPRSLYEMEHPVSAEEYVAPILAIGNSLNVDVGRLRRIENTNYVNINEFHNSIGSPWSEIYDLNERISTIREYAEKYPNLQWLGEKHSLLALMKEVSSYAVDAKWAIVHYHDWIQRAYDNTFNENEPSIYWDHFEYGNTIGNIHQEVEENVHIEDECIDPF